nr:hypothetical protein [Puia sp.]
MTNELIALIANIALTLSFIIAFIFGVAQVNTARRDRKERLTLETLREFQTREFVELMNYILRKDLPANREEMVALPGEEQIMLIQFGQIMESLGILVAERLINLELVDKTLGSFVTASWDKYKPLFQDIRVSQPDPYLGEYFQWLAEEIEDRMKRFPRQPIHVEHPRAK